MATLFLLLGVFFAGVDGINSPGASGSHAKDEGGVVRRHATTSFAVTSSGEVRKLGHNDQDSPEALVQALVDRPRDAGSLVMAKTFVEQLANKVAVENYKLSMSDDDAVAAIRQFINMMEDNEVTEHDEDQAELNQTKQLIDGCGVDAASAREGDAQSTKDTCDGKGRNHGACREEEQHFQSQKNEVCDAYHHYRKQEVPTFSDDCITSHMSAAQIASDEQGTKLLMETCLVSSMVWLPPLYEHYLACKEVADNHTAKKAICDADQHNYETCICTYAEEMGDVCTVESNCHARTTTAYSEAEERVRVVEAARKLDFAAGRKILCYIDVIAADEADKEDALARCAQLQIDDSVFDIFYPEPPAAPVCPIVSTPCDEGWTEYSSQSWHGIVETADCSICNLK